ncbi:hypothetical protein PRIEUP_LOCUS1230 [Pristimantis euphronides]
MVEELALSYQKFAFIPTKPLPSHIPPSFVVHLGRIYSPSNLQMVVLYRPPGPTAAFLDHFATCFLHFLSADIPAVIMGNFNIPVDMQHLAASKLLSLSSSFGLSQWFSAATHKNGHTLDLIFTRLCFLSNLSNSPFLSDHNLLTFPSLFPLTAPPDLLILRPYRNLKRLYSCIFSNSIQPLAILPSLQDTDTAFYNATVTTALNLAAPS